MNTNTATETQSSPVQVQRLTFTKREVQEALRISSVSLWRLEARGLLKPIPGFRHKRYSRAAIDRFIAS